MRITRIKVNYTKSLRDTIK